MHQILKQEIWILLRLNVSYFLVTNGIKNVTWFYGPAEKNICASVYCLKQPDIFVYLGEYTILPLLFFLRSLMSVGLSILIFDVKCSQLQPFFPWLSTFNWFKHPTRDLNRDDWIKKFMKQK